MEENEDPREGVVEVHNGEFGRHQGPRPTQSAPKRGGRSCCKIVTVSGLVALLAGAAAYVPAALQDPRTLKEAMKIITAVYEVYDKIKKTIAIDMIGKFRENHEIPGPTEKKDSGGGWFQTEEEKIKDKLKIEFDDNKCVTRRGLSLEDYKIFILQFAEMMKLPDSTRDHLLHASASSEAVDAMETFSNGLAGHYHYIKYVVVQKNILWSASYDVAIALHVEQWNFGLTDDTAKLTEAIHKQGLLTEGKDYKELTMAERNQIRATAEAFAVVNKKSAITAKERDIWTDYFHERAIKKFNKNCLKELLSEHKSETVI